MALTKVGKEGITGVSNSSDATAITIDSSENVGIGTNSPISNSTTNLQIHGGTASGSSELRLTNADTGATASDGLQLQMYQGTEAYINNRENGPIIFKTNNTEEMRLLAGGGLTFNGDTAAANALDDYEEGIHTASVTCGTSGTITLTAVGDDLSYTKVGNQVNIRGMLQIDSVSSPVGNIKIDLPFTNGSGSGFSARTPFEVFILNSSSNVRDFEGILFEGDDKLVIYLGDATSLQSDASQSLSGNEEIYVNATYKVA